MLTIHMSISCFRLFLTMLDGKTGILYCYFQNVGSGGIGSKLEKKLSIFILVNFSSVFEFSTSAKYPYLSKVSGIADLLVDTTSKPKNNVKINKKKEAKK